jgi:hypothetical protein
VCSDHRREAQHPCPHGARFCVAWADSALGAHLGDEKFLLDIDEAERYFPDDAARIARWNGEPRAWWLRTMGIKNHAAYVSKDGGINAHGYRADCPWCGVRPAMWVDMEEIRL